MTEGEADDMDAKRETRKSGFSESTKHNKPLAFSLHRLGQSYPQQNPDLAADSEVLHEPLGEPLSISQTAEVIGCSAWTVRQRYLPAGLPHHRLTPTGKLMFYRNQVIRWLLMRQREGVSNL